VVNFCETFCTCSLSSLKHDHTVESARKWDNFICTSWARNGRFGVFFEKNGLGPLGVKNVTSKLHGIKIRYEDPLNCILI
jgi:hypothetical protein